MNIADAAALIRQAADSGADYVQTPEMTSLLVRERERLLAAITDEEHDPALAAFRDLARELRIWLHIGSLPVRFPDHRDRVANRGFLIGPDGDVAARYDKIHMFDVDLAKGESWRESQTYQPGETAVAEDLPWGRLGMSICYDLRFSALYRALAEHGADFLAVPAAFTRQTGEAHWHVLLRARAIETGSFVFAAAQGGTHEDGRETYGHSLIVDPWGVVLAEGGEEPGVVMAKIDPAPRRGGAAEHSGAAERPAFRGDGARGPAAAGGGIVIRYSLQCEQAHGFDGWFRSSDDFDGQAASGLLSCPVCGSGKVDKALMAPAVRGADRGADEVPTSADERQPAPTGDVALLGEREQKLRQMLRAVREELTRNAENVGPRFAEVARQMHDGEVEKASIYGRASAEEVRALAEDGVDFHPLPGLPDEAN